MQLKLDKVAPTPLLDKIRSGSSAVWLNELQLEQGEQVFIQAPSGTGKTTLVHLLYRLRNDMQGSISWAGNDISSLGEEQLANLRSRHISIIFQDMRLFPELTAWENLEIKRGLTGTADAGTVSGWMQRLGIEHKKNAPARTLSYGEQQRVAIIRALLQPFDWLLMDEPFSHLDRGNIQKAAGLIQDVVAQNNAGIIVADLEDNDHFPYTRKLTL